MTDAQSAFREDLLAWSADNLREFPWRDTFRKPYEVFVAELLLTRTRAEMVADVYEEFLDRYPSFDALADADPAEVANLIEGLGLHNKRSRVLVDVAEGCGDEGLPRETDALTELSHVGAYIAHVTRCFGFGEPCPIVDANVHRTFSRLLGRKRFDGPEDDDLWEFAGEMLPEDYEAARRYNLALLDFGALVCKPRTPDCETCFATDYCEYYARHRSD
jgi:A/G-specific adenine glycosylase